MTKQKLLCRPKRTKSTKPCAVRIVKSFFGIDEACELAAGAIVLIMAKVIAIQPPEKLLRKDKHHM